MVSQITNQLIRPREALQEKNPEMQHSSTDLIDEQRIMLQNQPYVKRTQEFFNMIKESMGADSAEWKRFKDELNHGKNTESYEKPLMMVYNKVKANALLTKIFVELTPENFVTRMLPDCQQNLVKNFDDLVRARVTPEVYAQFQKYALAHLNQQNSVKEFRQNLESLFKGHHEIFASLPQFFCDTNGDLSILPLHVAQKDNQSVQQTKVQTVKQQKPQPTPQKKNKSCKNYQSDQSVDSSRKVDLPQQISTMTNQLNMPLARQIPDELRTFAKGEVSLFTEKLPSILSQKSQSTQQQLLKLLDLYITGVLSQVELLALIEDITDHQNAQEVLKSLNIIIAGREKSRREAFKNILKPLSEVDGDDRVSSSYYKLPPNFPWPISSGMYQLPKEVKMNDQYFSLGTGNEKFQNKKPYDNEEALFKNEDEMYRVDHQIVQLEVILSQLQKEKANAEAFEKQQDQPKQRYQIKYLSKFSLDNIQQIYQQKCDQEIVISDKIVKAPVKAIGIYMQRIQNILDNIRQERQNTLELWNQISEQNFYKSLDQMSFFFKSQQSKAFKKNQIELELKTLSQLKKKSLNQLKGGCKSGEFFSTFSSFQFNNVVVYPATLPQEVQSDHPMNLQDPSLLSKPDLLPQMRLIHNDKKVLDRTFELLLYGARNMNQGPADRAKLESLFELLITHFYQLDFARVNTSSRSLKPPTDEHIELVSDFSIYKKWKKQGNVFSRHQEFIGQSSEVVEKGSREESNDQCVQLIKENSCLLVPHYKQGYSLMYGTPFCFCIIKMVSTIYERFVKAQQLIKQETIAKVGEDFKGEELEQICEERFEMFVSILSLTLCGQQLPSDRKIDTSDYEEIVRKMMGKEAYLAFVFDKLVTQTLKIILQNNEEDFTASLQVFKQFQEGEQKSEHLYLKKFTQKMDQLACFRGDAVRLLYSPQSTILSVHLINLQPYPSPRSSPRSKEELGKLDPVFLDRNLEKMKQMRSVEEVSIQNGLLIRKLPQTSKLYYEGGTEDIIEYKRKSALNVEEEFKTMHKQVLEMDQVLKRRKL